MPLNDPFASPEFSFSLTGMSLPNGIVAVDGGLCVTGGHVAAEPKIVYLAIGPTAPTRILSQNTWLSMLPDFPNGLTYHGAAPYVTNYRPGFGG
jgi:hypothetical protein